MSKHNLTVAHISGDCGNFLGGNTHDLFAVKHNGEIIAEIHFAYAHDSSTLFNASCTRIEHANAPQIFSEVHITANVTATVIRAFNENHEFYCDAFVNEDGDEIELPMFDVIKGV